MLIGLPVAFSLLVTGVLMMLWMDVFDPQILADAMYNGADSFPLMAISLLPPGRRTDVSRRHVEAYRDSYLRRCSGTFGAASATLRSLHPCSWPVCLVRRSLTPPPSAYS